MITVNNGATLSLTNSNQMAQGHAVAADYPLIVLNGSTMTSTAYNPLGNIVLNGATLFQNSFTANGNPNNAQGYVFVGSVTVGGTAASTISAGANDRGNHLMSNTIFDVANATGDSQPDLTVSCAFDQSVRRLWHAADNSGRIHQDWFGNHVVDSVGWQCRADIWQFVYRPNHGQSRSINLRHHQLHSQHIQFDYTVVVFLIPAVRAKACPRTAPLRQVQSSGTIDLGNGSSILQLADSHTQVWNPGTGVRLFNWSGNLNTGGGTDQFIVGPDDHTGLTVAQLSAIKFAGYAAGAKFVTGGTGEIVPTSATILFRLGDLNFSGSVNASDLTVLLQTLTNFAA